MHGQFGGNSHKRLESAASCRFPTNGNLPPAFAVRLAFGWRSDAPIQRIKEAIAEIKKVARKEPTLAAEGAVTFLVKLSPALVQVELHPLCVADLAT